VPPQQRSQIPAILASRPGDAREVSFQQRRTGLFVTALGTAGRITVRNNGTLAAFDGDGQPVGVLVVAADGGGDAGPGRRMGDEQLLEFCWGHRR
jgi:hypothetical protein